MMRLALALYVLFGCPIIGVFAADTPTKGHLVIIGGGRIYSNILQRFVELAGGAAHARIIVIPMASSDPVDSGHSQVEEFKSLGVTDVKAVLVRREQATSPEVLASLDPATGIFFTGGDQARLATNLVGTAVQQKLLALYNRGSVIGGTSAGAAIMSEVMITGDQQLHPQAKDGFTTIEKGNVVTTAGLGFLTNAIVDQHFIARKRENRLFGLILEHPNLLGIGIDEDTAVIVAPDGTLEVIGERSVMIFDARRSPPCKVDSHSNLAGRNVSTHLLVAGDRFDPAL
jgi:cyanophycinase